MTKTGPVPDDWHVTTSWPDTDGTFSTAHGYTKGRQNYDVVRSTVTVNIPLDTKREGKNLWPSDSKYPTEFLSVDYLNSVLEKDLSHLEDVHPVSKRPVTYRTSRDCR